LARQTYLRFLKAFPENIEAKRTYFATPTVTTPGNARPEVPPSRREAGLAMRMTTIRGRLVEPLESLVKKEKVFGSVLLERRWIQPGG
jgi:hypothetical protein